MLPFLYSRLRLFGVGDHFRSNAQMCPDDARYQIIMRSEGDGGAYGPSRRGGNAIKIYENPEKESVKVTLHIYKCARI